MMKFEGSHILSVSQFDRDAISRILQVAAQMAPYAMRNNLACSLIASASTSHVTTPRFTACKISAHTNTAIIDSTCGLVEI